MIRMTKPSFLQLGHESQMLTLNYGPLVQLKGIETTGTVTELRHRGSNAV